MNKEVNIRKISDGFLVTFQELFSDSKNTKYFRKLSELEKFIKGYF